MAASADASAATITNCPMAFPGYGGACGDAATLHEPLADHHHHRGNGRARVAESIHYAVDQEDLPRVVHLPQQRQSGGCNDRSDGDRPAQAPAVH